MAALTQSNEGVCKNVYFHNADDWSKFIVLFNGALTEAKIAVERAPFQRHDLGQDKPVERQADQTLAQKVEAFQERVKKMGGLLGRIK